LRRNRLALDALALRQRVLVNVADVDLTTTILGQKLASERTSCSDLSSASSLSRRRPCATYRQSGVAVTRTMT
jgi:hypothetical protein